MSVFSGESRGAPRCAADGCNEPMDHRIHNVVIDGTTFSVPTCGKHDDIDLAGERQ